MRINSAFAIAALAAATLARPALSLAGDGASEFHPKPASFAPHSHTNHHVYGSPITSPIVGHSKASHHKRAQKK
jgi:hypothetical protein